MRVALLSVLLAFGLVSGTSGAVVDDETSVPYKARVKGLWYGELKSAVTEQSMTMALVKQPPATLRQLQLRAEEDAPAMAAALKARGYLEASVIPALDTNQTPVRVTFRVIKGPVYTVSGFRVIYTNTTDVIPQPPHVGLKARSPAGREVVDAAEEAALRFLRERGYPQPRKQGEAVVRDDIRKTVAVVCVVDPGRRAKFGATEIFGNERVDIKYLRRRIPWEPGDTYNIETVEELEKELLQSGLFRTVRVTATNSVDPAGLLPVKVSVVERPFRTVRAGLSYYTDEGVGGEGSWENRNVFGGAEVLSVTLFASEIKYGAKTRYTQPDFTARNADLHWDVDAAEETPEAYESKHVRTALVLEKRMDHGVTVTAGGAYEHEKVEQQDQVEQYNLLSLPLDVEVDGRDNKLDPAKGSAFRVGTEPFQDILSDLLFLKSEVEGSLFIGLSRSPQVVLATRAMVGSITGASGEEVPADKRFYAGGGGTIRGYKYQSVGELEDGEPVGGNGIATVSTELRARITRSLGAACFLDGGTAYPDTIPDSDMPFLWAVGAGLRYYMGFTPLRVDIAFPLQPRGDVDADFQIYVSLGQAF